MIVPPAEKSLEGEIILVTGSANGLGRQLSLQLSLLGCVVVCWDLDAKGNEETVRLARNQGGRAYGFQCDVSNRANVQKVAAQVRQDVGDVTVIINNAAILHSKGFLGQSSKEIERIFDVNVLGYIWVLQEFLPHMIETRHGHMVSVSSAAGLLACANAVPYSATKFAVRGIMEGIKEELRVDIRNTDIHFTTVYPFIMATGMVQKPLSRFQSILPITDPKVAAAKIIQGFRRNYVEVTIPDLLFYTYVTSRLFPVKLKYLIQDFLGCGMGVHME